MMSHSIRAAIGAGVATALLAAVVAPAALAGPASFPDRLDLPDGFRPEGISAGPGTTFYVGSLADGAIWRGDVRTGDGAILAAGASGRASVGTEYEAGADRLWVAGGATGEIRVHDASTGTLLETYPFAGGFFNDVAVTPTAIYVTDSIVAQLVVIPLGADGTLPSPDAAFSLPIVGDLVYVDGFNVNGIVELRGWLVVVQSNTGGLFRIDPGTGVSRQIETHGASVPAGDGLFVRGSHLWVVQNQLNVVTTFDLGPNLEQAVMIGELTSPDLDIPTTAIVSAGRLWAVNARFSTPPTPDTAYWVTQLPVRP
jgi:hypothetical protein